MRGAIWRRTGVIIYLWLSSATVALAGDDITVVISHDYLEQAIVNAVKKLQDPTVAALIWKPTISRSSRTELHIHVGGSIAGGSGDEAAKIDLDVELGCGASVAGSANSCDAQSHIKIAIKNVAVASVVGPLPESTRAQLEAAIQAKAGEISAELSCRLHDGLQWTHKPDICPVFDVTNAGTVKATLDLVSGCVTGLTKTKPCENGFRGNGTSLLCVNGRWAFQSRQCIYIETPNGRQRGTTGTRVTN